MDRIIECVPNFSEGRSQETITAIATAIGSVEGVVVCHIDIGEAANRTVITFLGPPDKVPEAAFRGVKEASTHIDMRHHQGEHPRIGATDVLPLIPLRGVSLEECAHCARQLAHRISTELQIPTYCYEAAAFIPSRRNLAACRKGEYEGIAQKITTDAWKPDYGVAQMSDVVQKSGITVVGARNFLIAVNFNLNTSDKKIAHEIACDLRESGRIVKLEGQQKSIPGAMKKVKAIGWYIREYGCAQVSVNITDIKQAPLHEVFQTVSRLADKRGVRVTGTEIIGMVPQEVLVASGRYFSTPNATEQQAIEIAIEAMHLDELQPFIIEEKVLVY